MILRNIRDENILKFEAFRFPQISLLKKNIVIKAAKLISVEIKRKYLSELSGFGAVKCRKDEIKRYLNYCYNPGRELCGQDKLLAIF